MLLLTKTSNSPSFESELAAIVFIAVTLVDVVAEVVALVKIVFMVMISVKKESIITTKFTHASINKELQLLSKLVRAEKRVSIVAAQVVKSAVIVTTAATAEVTAVIKVIIVTAYKATFQKKITT